MALKKQSHVETNVQTSQTTTVDHNDVLWGTPWTSSDKIIVQVADKNKNLSSHCTITKTNNIQCSLVKDSKSKELQEEKIEGKIKSWGAPCSLLKSTKSDPSVSWGTPWDPSKWWQPSGLSNKDLCNNRQTMVPGSRHAMHNIGKVVGMSENVSKTETTHLKNNALSITSAKTHDSIDFDRSMSNDTMELTVSNNRKPSTNGNMYKDLSTKHAVQDISIQSLIKTSTIQNLGTLEAI